MSRYWYKYRGKKVRKPKCLVTIDDIDQVKRCVAACGNRFFSPENMRFHKSRAGKAFHDGRGGAYFVTSEAWPHTGRRWAIHYYNPESCSIDTIGRAGSRSNYGWRYTSSAGATSVARRVAAKSKKRRRGYRMYQGRRLKGAR